MSVTMIRGGANIVKPLINYQARRGAFKDTAARLGSPDNLQKITQLIRKVSPAIITELRPPTPAELPQAIRDGVRMFTKGNWRSLTVREAWLNTLVTAEVLCWFFVGEVIGKGTLIGYQAHFLNLRAEIRAARKRKQRSST